MPDLTFPMATLVFFQFVFAAITVIILAGSVLGRMSFKAWVIFYPIWMTCVYTVGAFSLWGGGWLATMGAVDFSGRLRDSSRRRHVGLRGGRDDRPPAAGRPRQLPSHSPLCNRD